ncbi:TPA: magnesium transporter [Candidatus Poribacteria bacterium]|nr:magnesium transporter [Candidatus Poribacteria bacterium]
MDRILLTADDVRSLLGVSNRAKLIERLQSLYPAEIAELIRDLEERDRVILFRLLQLEQAVEVFEEFEADEQEALLLQLSKRQRAEMLDEMAPDERADMFAEFSDELVQRLLPLMKPAEQRDVQRLMQYPEDSAGGIMTTDYAALPAEMSISQSLEELRKMVDKKETIRYVYVTDSTGMLIGFLHFEDIVFAAPDETIEGIMRQRVISVSVDMDREEVAQIIAQFDLNVIPVVDAEGKLCGIVTVDDIIDVIEEEATEDIYKLGAAGKPADSYFGAKLFTVSRRRITWLLVLVVAGFISGAIIEYYEVALQSLVALAFFIPVLMDSGGNAGTQASTVVVRGLAVGDIRLRDVGRVLLREFTVGALVGTAMAILTAGRALLTQKNPLFGAAVGVAMFATVCIATTAGAILPLFFTKLKFDPAVSSGPFITTVVDVLALIVYFEIAKLLLGI